MKKNWLLKIGLVVFSVLLFCPFFASAIVFHLTGLEQIYALSPERVLDNMMYVHFADNGNDFGGFMYFANNLGDEESTESNEIFEVVATGHDSIYECRSQVKGFYYNAERGERLWPLDGETWKSLTGMQGLQMSGGIYTLCAQEGYQAALDACEKGVYTGCKKCEYNECVAKVRNDYSAGGYGYYGSIQHVYKGITGNLIMGVDYETNTSKFITIKPGSDLAPTFVRLNNKFPVGFIYDNKGGLGLAGCMIGSGSLTGGSMKNLVREVKEKGIAGVFHPVGTGYIEYTGSLQGITCTGISFQDRLTKILIEGIMGLSNGGTGGDTKFGTIGNSSDTKMQYFATKSVSNVTMMNYVRRRAELLCRGKWKETSPAINASGEKIICLDGVNVGSGMAIQAKEFGKTLIVKNGNVTISPMSTAEYMRDSNLNEFYYDIFILSGNLLIDEEDASKFAIDNKGFITNEDINNFRQSIIIRYINGNYGVAQNKLVTCMNSGVNCEFWMDIDNDGFVNETDFYILIEWQTNSVNNSNSNSVAVASVINGNFIVNGNVEAASGSVLNHKYFIYGKFTTKDTISTLENVFAWRCDNEAGSDGNFCPKFNNNPYRNASLVVVDQNYSSPLLQS